MIGMSGVTTGKDRSVTQRWVTKRVEGFPQGKRAQVGERVRQGRRDHRRRRWCT